MIRKVKLTDFIRNVLTLTTGTTIAQAIPVLISPVLTRLYKPEDFGLLALFISITTLLSVVVTGKYELAVVLPQEDQEAQKLVRLSLILTLGCSGLLLVLILCTHGALLSLFKDKRIGFWLYFIPLSVFFTGVYESFRYYSVRHKAYKDISTSSIMKSGTGAVFQIAAGFAGAAVAGLLWGNMLSLLSGNLGVTKAFFKKRDKEISLLSTKDLKQTAARYRNFPRFTLPSLFLNTASTQLPAYVFATFFSNAIVGFFALSQRVLNMPMSIIGNAIGQVYFQKASEHRGNILQLQSLTWKLYKHLLLMGILPIGILLFWGAPLFAWVFGESWRIAGQYASLLSIWTLFVFISSPLSSLFFVQEKQKQALILQVIIFLSRAVLLLLCILLHYDAALTVMLFGIVGAVIFFFFIFYLLSSIGISKWTILGYTVMVCGAGIIPLYIIDKLLSWR